MIVRIILNGAYLISQGKETVVRVHTIIIISILSITLCVGSVRTTRIIMVLWIETIITVWYPVY